MSAASTARTPTMSPFILRTRSVQLGRTLHFYLVMFALSMLALPCTLLWRLVRVLPGFAAH